MNTIKQLREQAVTDEINVRRMEIKGAGAENRNPSISQRVTVIRALADLDREAEEQRHKQKLEQLQQEEEDARREAELLGQIFTEEKIYHGLRENEERRHQQEPGRIKGGQDQEERAANPLKAAFDDLKKTTSFTDFLSNQAAARLYKMSDAFGQAIEANILYGKSIGKALKAGLAEYLAHGLGGGRH